MTKKLIAFLAPLLVSFSTGCMTYRNFPTQSPASMPAKREATLHYNIDGSALFAGPSAIRDVLASDAPYSSLSPSDKPGNSGDFLQVKIDQSPPSMPAVVFGYISYSTLTILPFWSNQDGSILTFTLYRNGAQQESKEYLINRGTFVWLGMLPFAWVNFMTPSEADAFRACARDFLARI